MRLMLESHDADGGRRSACAKIGHQIGVSADTLRGWAHRAEFDGGRHDDTTTRRISSLRDRSHLSGFGR